MNLEEDLIYCFSMETMDRTLNLMFSETPATDKPPPPSELSERNESEITVHFSVAPTEKKKKEKQKQITSP